MLLALEDINDVVRFVRYQADELSKPSELVKELIDEQVRSALNAVRDAEQVCNLDMEDVKAEINSANLTFKSNRLFTSLDHAFNAKAKFETKICKTGV